MLPEGERGDSLMHYMGQRAKIANPDARRAEENRRASPAALSEQGLGRGAVGGGLAPVSLDPRDLGFEQGDAFVELGL